MSYGASGRIKYTSAVCLRNVKCLRSSFSTQSNTYGLRVHLRGENQCTALQPKRSHV